MKKKIIKFFFPIPAIVITTLMLLLFAWYSYEEVHGHILAKIITAIGLTLLFYTIFVIPFDIIIYLIRIIVNKISKKQELPPKVMRVIKCDYCGNYTPVSHLKCVHCGKQLTIICPKCYYKCHHTDHYCINCGRDLTYKEMTPYQIERYAIMCNAYLEHEDEMEQYKK